MSWAAPSDLYSALHLREADETRLQRVLDSANSLILRALDRPASAPALPDPPPAELVSAEVQVAARLYMAEANPLGVISTSVDTIHFSSDPLGQVWHLLSAWSYNRGIG